LAFKGKAFWVRASGSCCTSASAAFPALHRALDFTGSGKGLAIITKGYDTPIVYGTQTRELVGQDAYEVLMEERKLWLLYVPFLRVGSFQIEDATG
jgi:hypothetical protein